MIHQPSGGFQGQASDIDIHAREILKVRERLNAIMAKHTGQTVERIERDMERDNFMEAQAAVEYGLVDTVLAKRADAASKALSLASISARVMRRSRRTAKCLLCRPRV